MVYDISLWYDYFLSGLAEIRAKAIKKKYEEKLREARERGEPIDEPSDNTSEEESEEEQEVKVEIDVEKQEEQLNVEGTLVTYEDVLPPPLEDEDNLPVIKSRSSNTLYNGELQGGLFSNGSTTRNNSVPIITEVLPQVTSDTNHKEKVLIEVVEQVGQGLEEPSTVPLTNTSFITYTLY